MIGRPVFEPRTALPGLGVGMLASLRYENRSRKLRIQ